MKPIIKVNTDVVVNDSDKTITVPNAETRDVKMVAVQLTTTATVGNRQIAYEVLDASDNVIYASYAGATQAASLVRTYHFAQGMTAQTAFIGTAIRCELPTGLVLPPGFKMHVFDQAVIDAAADDMEVRYVYDEFPL